MRKLSNEISFTLNYSPSDIRYEPAIPPSKYDPGTPAAAWLEKATVDGVYDEYGEEVEATLWMLEKANDNAMFENQLIQEAEKDLQEWAEEKAAYEYEWKVGKLVDAKFERLQDPHADYFGGMKRAYHG